MSTFGPCSDSSCTEQCVRLFDCAHHCMKFVCLQHLIEHDRLIDFNQQYFDELRTELQQSWATYSLLVNETKLRLELEQKLKKHRQLIEDVANVCQYDLENIEPYRLTLEKLQQSIEQEKQLHQESALHVEQVKNEPFDSISTSNEYNSFDINMASGIEKFNKNDGSETRRSMTDSACYFAEECFDLTTTYNYHRRSCSTTQSKNNETIISPRSNAQPIKQLSGHCPFWFDGAFGLSKKSHDMYLCFRGQYYRDLYRHLIQFHRLTLPSVKTICQAIQNNKDSLRNSLFQSHDIVIDRIRHLVCPFSIHHNALPAKTPSSIRRCRSAKLQFEYTLRYHLTHRHQMKPSSANKLINTLKTVRN